jgi:hypothetical protein
MRPGCFTIGSPQSRAAARALLAARKENERHVGFGSIVNGRVNLDGLAERLRAAIERHEARESPDSRSQSVGSQDGGEGREDCLEERIKRAWERVERM